MRSATALALLYLRAFEDVTQEELTALLGYTDRKLLSRYETGGKELSREQLEDLLAPLGTEDGHEPGRRYPPEAVDLLLFTHAQLTQIVRSSEPEPAASPLALGRDELRTIDRTCLTVAWTVADRLRPALVRLKRAAKAAAARREAEEQVHALLAAPRAEQRGLVEIFPQLQGWAVAERLGHESVRRAAHDAAEALELAELALAVAGREEDEGLRAAAEGYGWAFAGNARRVANDFDSADAAFVRAKERWQDEGGISWVRILWLRARIDAGQGREDQAARTLELVRREFDQRKLAYDAALASLDLAVLLLDAGRTAEVRELAFSMAWIFRAKGIRREALASLSLFDEAARQEVASAALARQVSAALRKTGNGPASRPANRPKGRE